MPLGDFGEVAATITSGDGTTCEVCLLTARDSEQRARGLMGVTDPELGGYDGMVFIYDEPQEGAFWMKNTLLPLSIAYFASDGSLVSTTDMDPCPPETSSCPTYPAEGAFQYAVEVPQGDLAAVGITGAATLELHAFVCPDAPT